MNRELGARCDLKNPATLKRLPSISGYSERNLAEVFAKTKAERLRELEYRLWLLKINEQHRQGTVNGMDVELAFRRLAKQCGGKEKVMYGIATAVTYHFDPEGRRVLLAWLLDIEESMRWDRRRYLHALHPEEAAK